MLKGAMFGFFLLVGGFFTNVSWSQDDSVGFGPNSFPNEYSAPHCVFAGDYGNYTMDKLADSDRRLDVIESRVETVARFDGTYVATVKAESRFGGVTVTVLDIAPGCTLVQTGSDYLNTFGIGVSPTEDYWSPNAAVTFQQQRYWTPSYAVDYTYSSGGWNYTGRAPVNGLDWMAGVGREAVYNNIRMMGSQQ